MILIDEVCCADEKMLISDIIGADISPQVDNANGGDVDVQTTRMPCRSNCISSESDSGKIRFSFVGSDNEMKHDGQASADGVVITKLPINSSSTASLIGENCIGRKQCAGAAKYSTHLQVDRRRRRGDKRSSSAAKCSVCDAACGCKRPFGEHLQSSSSTHDRKPEVAELSHVASHRSFESSNGGRAVAPNVVKLKPVESRSTNGIDHLAANGTTEELAIAGRSNFEPPPSSSAFVCTQCGWSFRRRDTLQQHHALIHTVTKAVALTCGTCGIQFVNGSSLRRHMATNICSSSSSNRRRHQRPVRPCPTCGKIFSRGDTLAQHVLIHEKPQLFACDICGRQLSSALKRQRHLLLHDELTATTRSQCPVCEKWFRDKGSVKEHLVAVHDERPTDCDVCGKTFRGRKRFNSHMLCHTRPYGCTRCGRRFGAKIRLTRHVRSGCDSDANTSGPACGNPKGKYARIENPLKLSAKWNSFRNSQRTMDQRTALKLDEDDDSAVTTCRVKKGREKFTNRTNLLQPFGRFYVKRPDYICEYCGQMCASSRYLANHLASCHTEVEAASGQLAYVDNNTRMPALSVSVMLWKFKFQSVANDDDDGITLPFICAVCFETFNCRRTLRQHVCGSQSLASYTDDLKQLPVTAESSLSSRRHSRSTFVDHQSSELSPELTSVDQAAGCGDVGNFGSGYAGAYDRQSRANSGFDSPRVDSGDDLTSHATLPLVDVNRFETGGEESREGAIEDCGSSASNCEVVSLPDSPSQVVDGDDDDDDDDDDGFESSSGAIVATPVDDRTLADIVNQIGQGNSVFLVDGEDGSRSVNFSREAASTSDDAYWTELHERAAVQLADDAVGGVSSCNHSQKQDQQLSENEDTIICKRLSIRNHHRKCNGKLSVVAGHCGATGLCGQFYNSVVDDVDDFVDVFCKPNLVTAVDSNCSDRSHAENGDVEFDSVIHLLESRQYYEDNGVYVATDSLLLSADPSHAGDESGATQRPMDYDDTGRCEEPRDDALSGCETENNDETSAAADAANGRLLSASGNVEGVEETASRSTSGRVKLVTASTSNGHVTDVDDDDVKRQSAVEKEARSSKSDLSCEVCGKTFTRKSNLRQHKMTHGSVKPFNCKTCHRQFSRQSSLTQHSVIHGHLATSFKSSVTARTTCTICNRKFTRKSNLNHHVMTVHLGKRPHRCETCGYCFARRSCLFQHVKLHDKKLPTTGDALTSSTEPKINEVFVETETNVPADIVELFSRKVIDNEPNDSMTVENDDVDVATAKSNIEPCRRIPDNDANKGNFSIGRQSRRQRRRREDCDAAESVEDDVTTSCRRQSEWLSKISSSLLHVAEQRTVECAICGEIFAASHKLISHLRIHRPNKRPRCEGCRGRFKTEAAYWRHTCWFVVRKCSKWKACCECDVTFPTSQLLRDHERLVHVADAAAGSDWLRQFETFCEQQQLQQLKECLSSGSRRYLCEYCGVCLTSSDRWRQHLTYHALGGDNVVVSAATAGGGYGGGYEVGCQSSSSSFVASNNSQEVCLSWLSPACVTMWNFKVDYDSGRISLPYFCAKCRQQFTDRIFLLSHVCRTFGTSSSSSSFLRHRRGRRKASGGRLVGDDAGSVIIDLGRLLKFSRQRVHREPDGNDSKRCHCKLSICNVVNSPLMAKTESVVIEKSAPIPGAERVEKFCSVGNDGMVEMICIDEEFEQLCKTTSTTTTTTAAATMGDDSGSAMTFSRQTKIGF